MEKLTIERTNPVQGEPVNIYFHSSRGHCGQAVLTYEEWLHFNKLIREGIDSLKRKNETRIEIKVVGIGGKIEQTEKEAVVNKEKPKVINDKALDQEVEEILSSVGKQIESDNEDQKGIDKAEKSQSLVRSLIVESEKDENNFYITKIDDV